MTGVHVRITCVATARLVSILASGVAKISVSSSWYDSALHRVYTQDHLVDTLLTAAHLVLEAAIIDHVIPGSKEGRSTSVHFGLVSCGPFASGSNPLGY